MSHVPVLKSIIVQLVGGIDTIRFKLEKKGREKCA